MNYYTPYYQYLFISNEVYAFLTVSSLVLFVVLMLYISYEAVLSPKENKIKKFFDDKDELIESYQKVLAGISSLSIFLLITGWTIVSIVKETWPPTRNVKITGKIELAINEKQKAESDQYNAAIAVKETSYIKPSHIDVDFSNIKVFATIDGELKPIPSDSEGHIEGTLVLPEDMDIIKIELTGTGGEYFPLSLFRSITDAEEINLSVVRLTRFPEV